MNKTFLRIVLAGAILLAALTFTATGQVRAQEQPPDLQMLLNLDLFSSPTGASDSQAPGASGSMLDQIRALRQMGLLNSHQDAGPQPLPPPGPPPSEIPPWLFAPTGGGQ